MRILQEKKFMTSEQVLRGWKKNYCWLARDVTATMLVVFRVKNKSICLLWELNLVFM